MNTSSTHRALPLSWLLVIGLLLVASLGLIAQPRSSATPSCLKPLVAAESSSSAAEARALLPFVSPRQDLPLLSLPGERSMAPDAFKILYGYQGPYYSTALLDGRVKVLYETVYTWPTPNWKATGMVRNQTRCSAHIRSVTARLVGSEGKTLGIATATVPIADLRPGEPGPITIEAQLPVEEVKSVEWHVDSEEATSPARQFEFTIDENRLSSISDEYVLEGIIQNVATTTTRGVRVVAAWLDAQNRVLVVAEPQFDNGGNLETTADLAANGDDAHQDSGVFKYITDDPALALRIGRAPNFALWGVSK